MTARALSGEFRGLLHDGTPDMPLGEWVRAHRAAIGAALELAEAVGECGPECVKPDCEDKVYAALARWREAVKEVR